MKRLDKKGFAISTLIYSILIMGILIMGMLYSTMAFRKKSTQDFTRKVEENLIEREIKNYTICKAATELHTDGVGGYYGRIPSGTIEVGDAFDCDVNGNNVFEAEERFYYLAPENGEEGSTRYVLIYSSNTALFLTNIVIPVSDKTVAYSAGVFSNVQAAPKTASKSLPPADTWSNTALLAPGTVNITDENRMVKVPNFNYGDTLTRLPRLTEFVSATNSLAFLNLTNHNSLSTYSFLFENLGTIKGYWFEEVASSSKTEGWVVNNTSKSITKVSTGSTEYGTRPVIVVEKENVYFE